ncbi:MAG: tRNA (adenosine(37)-N6)-dimethylallyltransferase MiaA [Acidimicrobiales bacterium]|jgi:tRNA dimethylallyltransferase|nr:tRNA (adenosine(37)-N6)-dimethylallyltransferase MiaA [Acidimicrobiales bacterium]
MQKPIAIVGPTAAGKSALAMELARIDDSIELLSVDSMQVYRGMDIGTAKPTISEQQEVRHHLIDMVEPKDSFTFVEYQNEYKKLLIELKSREAQPLLVGGTGLYLRAAIDGLTPPPQFPEVMAQLETEIDTELLHRRLVELDPAAAAKMDSKNRRRIARALEVTLGSGKPFSSFGPGLDKYEEAPYELIGIEIDRSLLDLRIVERYEMQMDLGFLDEVRRLSDGEMSVTASQALGYRELLAYLRKETSLEEALATAIQRTKRFARRQQRWFRRDPRIHWIEFSDIGSFLDQRRNRVNDLPSERIESGGYDASI